MKTEDLNRELGELVEKAQARFEALSPSQKLRALYEQRRSFVRGMCPSSTDFKVYCAEIDKRLPPPNDLTDAEIGLVLLNRYTGPSPHVDDGTRFTLARVLQIVDMACSDMSPGGHCGESTSEKIARQRENAVVDAVHDRLKRDLRLEADQVSKHPRVPPCVGHALQENDK